MVDGSNGTCSTADTLTGVTALTEGLFKASPFSSLWLVILEESAGFDSLSDVGKPLTVTRGKSIC